MKAILSVYFSSSASLTTVECPMLAYMPFVSFDHSTLYAPQQVTQERPAAIHDLKTAATRTTGEIDNKYSVRLKNFEENLTRILMTFSTLANRHNFGFFFYGTEKINSHFSTIKEPTQGKRKYCRKVKTYSIILRSSFFDACKENM